MSVKLSLLLFISAVLFFASSSGKDEMIWILRRKTKSLKYCDDIKSEVRGRRDRKRHSKAFFKHLHRDKTRERILPLVAFHFVLAFPAKLLFEHRSSSKYNNFLVEIDNHSIDL